MFLFGFNLKEGAIWNGWVLDVVSSVSGTRQWATDDGRIIFLRVLVRQQQSRWWMASQASKLGR